MLRIWEKDATTAGGGNSVMDLMGELDGKGMAAAMEEDDEVFKDAMEDEMEFDLGELKRNEAEKVKEQERQSEEMRKATEDLDMDSDNAIKDFTS